jgi:hypothetical protein
LPVPVKASQNAPLPVYASSYNQMRLR